MLDLSESRAQIDVIDKEITRLFQKRIDVCRDVAAYKIQNNKKVDAYCVIIREIKNEI